MSFNVADEIAKKAEEKSKRFLGGKHPNGGGKPAEKKPSKPAKKAKK